VRVVSRNLQKLGVEGHVKSQARGWRENKGQTVVDIVTPEGLIARRADTILVTVGRRPNTDDLHAEVAGVEFGPRGYVKVDRQLRTSNPHVFAIGDVIGPPFLAHKATKEGVTAAEVIAGHPVELDVHAMPAAIFTDPEIAPWAGGPRAEPLISCSRRRKGSQRRSSSSGMHGSWTSVASRTARCGSSRRRSSIVGRKTRSRTG